MGIRNVAIIGRGAVGLLFGSVIAQNLGAGAVAFVMDEEHLRRSRGQVVTVNGKPSDIPVLPERDARPVDFVIVATKAAGLDAAIRIMGRLVGPDTRIMSLLNGITSEERIAARFGWERTAVSIAQGMDAVFIGPELTYEHPGEIRFGATPLTSPDVIGDIADFLERAGIAHAVEPDMRHRLWTKFMLNVGINQTCMAFGGTYGTASDPAGEQHRIFVAAMREARAVANAEGIDVTEDDLSAMVRLIASLDPDGLPSMAQDRVNEKPSEVDEFAGTVVRLARRHGILVPHNEFLLARIREIEASYGRTGGE